MGNEEIEHIPKRPPKNIDLSIPDFLQRVLESRKEYEGVFGRVNLTRELSVIMTAISKESKVLDALAREVLNPFETEEELRKFSEDIRGGKGLKLIFDDPDSDLSIGEEIQGDFIKLFFKEFFPELSISTIVMRNSIYPSNAVVVKMDDLREMKDILAGEDEEEEDDDDAQVGNFPIRLSMVETKILHNVQLSDVLKNELKAMIISILRRKGIIEKNNDLPLLIVGDIDDSDVRNLQERLRNLQVGEMDENQRKNLREFLNFVVLKPSDKGLEMRRGNMSSFISMKPKVLRFLYAVGDCAFVGTKKNKLEPPMNGIKVITVGEYLDINKNSNATVDRDLTDLGWITLLQEVNLDTFVPQYLPPLSLEERRLIHQKYLSTDRCKGEVPLKEAMAKVFEKFKDIFNSPQRRPKKRP